MGLKKEEEIRTGTEQEQRQLQSVCDCKDPVQWLMCTQQKATKAISSLVISKINIHSLLLP